MTRIRELSDSDVVTLRKLIDRERQRILNEIKEPPEHHLPTPECYLAKLPEDGIPGLVRDGSNDLPGSAECQLYQIIKDGAQYKLRLAYGTRLVFNVSKHALHTGYIVVQRDKAGRWVSPTVRTLLRGYLYTQLAQGGSCEVDIYAWNPEDEEDQPTGERLEAFDWLLLPGDPPIATGSKVVIAWFPDSGRWYVIETSCPA